MSTLAASEKKMPKNKDTTVIQAHLMPEEYKAFKAIAEKKDWSDKKLTEKIVKLFLAEAKSKPSKLNDL